MLPLMASRQGGLDEQMVGLLRYANYSRVAEELGVTRSAVARWAKGRQVTPWNLSQVEQLLGHTKEAAPPDERMERLMRTVDAIADKLGVTSEERTAIDAAAEARLPLPADETPGHPEADDPAEAEHRDRRR